MFKRIATLSIPLVILLSAFASVSAAQLDPVTLPAPNGEYAVSRVDRDLTDEAREESFTDDEDDVRRLLVTFYYPAEPAADAAYAPYASEPVRRALASSVGVPYAISGLINPQVYADQPAAAGTFPVLIFSPGFGAQPTFYTAQLTEIASHGYIIAVIAHTYSVPAAVFPNGDVITANTAGTNLDGDDDVFNVWVDDAAFVVDSLPAVNTDDPVLAGALNLTQVGVFGHSFGGALAATLVAQDDRVLAGINMDGSLQGAASRGEIEIGKPFLHMSSAAPDVTDEDLAALGITRQQLDEFTTAMNQQFATAYATAQPGYMLTIDQTAHMSYAIDVIYAAPLFGGMIGAETTGTLAADDMLGTVSAYTLAFFDQYVRGVEGASLAAVDFPGVELRMLDNMS